MNAIGHLTLHQLYDIFTGVVFVSSLLSSFLPPFEWFDKWPGFQAVYKVLKMTVAKWAALNIASVVYPQISQTPPPEAAKQP